MPFIKFFYFIIWNFFIFNKFFLNLIINHIKPKQMMRKIACLLSLAMLAGFSSNAQIDAGLFRYPDVSATKIVFVYANDIWVMPKEGGMAVKLSSSPGLEIMPKF